MPWQLVAERIGAAIDVVPLTDDGRIDLDAMAAMITAGAQAGRARAMSRTCSARCSTRKRAADLAHAVGAKILLDGCQAVPRLAVDVAALGCDFYVFSGHKLYGPTGIGVLWARAELLDAMPPWQGGGSMIDRVTFEKTTYAPPPGAVRGGHAAYRRRDRAACRDRLCRGHRARRASTRMRPRWSRETREALAQINSVRLFGPEDSAGIVSFAIEGVHPHDIGTILDESRRRDPRRASLRAAADGGARRRRRRRGRASASITARRTSRRWSGASSE